MFGVAASAPRSVVTASNFVGSPAWRMYRRWSHRPTSIRAVPPDVHSTIDDTSSRAAPLNVTCVHAPPLSVERNRPSFVAHQTIGGLAPFGSSRICAVRRLRKSSAPRAAGRLTRRAIVGPAGAASVVVSSVNRPWPNIARPARLPSPEPIQRRLLPESKASAPIAAHGRKSVSARHVTPSSGECQTPPPAVPTKVDVPAPRAMQVTRPAIVGPFGVDGRCIWPSSTPVGPSSRPLVGAHAGGALLVAGLERPEAQPPFAADRRVLRKERVLRGVRDRQVLPRRHVGAVVPAPGAVQVDRDRHADLLRIDQHRAEAERRRQLGERVLGPLAAQPHFLPRQQAAGRVDERVRLDQQGQLDVAVRPHRDDAAAIDVRMRDRHDRAGVGEAVGVGGNVLDRLQEALALAERARELGDRRLRAVQRAVVVVDEVAEQAVLPLGQRAEPDRHRQALDAGRVDRLVDLEAQHRANDDHRLADEQCEMLLALVAERIDGPARRVDHAHQRAQGGVAVLRAVEEARVARAPVGEALRDSGRERVGDRLRRRRADRRRRAGRVFPDDAVALVATDDTEVAAVGRVEQQRVVEVVRHEVAAHRRDLLVDVGLVARFVGRRPRRR